MCTPPCPRQLEERSLNAWPGVHQSLYDGWLVRFSKGYSKRANCAVPFYPGDLAPEDKVAWCEGEYGRRGQPAIFKILPFGDPADLDDHLEQRGYETHDRTLVLWAPLAGRGRAPRPERGGPATVRSGGDGDLEEYARLNGIPSAHLPRVAEILARTAGDLRFASVPGDGRATCCGLGVLEGQYLGLFGIATDPAVRRQGRARRLVRALLDWGMRGGAQYAYLQVRAQNDPARSLYTSLGFETSYEYWYRVQPLF